MSKIFLTGLFYESESKRFLNNQHENFTYNWVDYELDKQLAEKKALEIPKDIILPNRSFDIELPTVNNFPFIDEQEIHYPPIGRNALTLNDYHFKIKTMNHAANNFYPPRHANDLHTELLNDKKFNPFKAICLK